MLNTIKLLFHRHRYDFKDVKLYYMGGGIIHVKVCSVCKKEAECDRNFLKHYCTYKQREEYYKNPELTKSRYPNGYE